jgi:alkylation response protein AidB-like acyl-CoA dehydrogenase
MTSTIRPPRLFGDHFLPKLDCAEQAMVHKVRQLVHDHIGPRAAQVAQKDVFAWENFRLLASERVLATAFPREYGGTDASQALKIRIIEELSRVCSATASIMTGADLSTRAVAAGASQAFQQMLLPGLCEGTLQCAFALTEPAAGSDVRGLETTIEQDGDHYIIHGAKKYITRATTADWFVVIGKARHAPSSFIAVLVPRDASGFYISPEVPKLGWYGVPISSLAFEGVRIPLANRLGQEGDGLDLAQDALVRARIGHASMAIGRAIGAVEIAATYACDRSVFGKSLGHHQGIQWMLADMVSQIEAVRCLVSLVAEKYDQGDNDVSVFASMAKLQATDLCMKVVTDALQITGGRGYLQDFPLERFFRDAKLNQIGEGSSEVHKTLIGRDIVRRAPNSERNASLRTGSLVDY